jgi:endogenous inhibitor of DNA gyrase (YacG/DUF329 family)
MTTIAERQVPCPGCRQPTLYSERNPWRPFCSARCRGVDLGAWANENYRVAVKPTSEDEDPPDENPKPH